MHDEAVELAVDAMPARNAVGEPAIGGQIFQAGVPAFTRW